jgi:hypothetical protein
MQPHGINARIAMKINDSATFVNVMGVPPSMDRSKQVTHLRTSPPREARDFSASVVQTKQN